MRLHLRGTGVMRIVDYTLRASAGQVMSVDEEKGETVLVGGGITLTISIVEQVMRINHTPTRAEVRARDRYLGGVAASQPPVDDHASRGRLKP